MTKRCDKCGATSNVAPRVRRCTREAPAGDHTGAYRRTALGRLWLCYGVLRKVERPRRRRPRTDEAREAQLEKFLSRAHDELAAAMTRMKRTVTAIGNWQTRIRRAERVLEALRKREPPPTQTRAIMLPETGDEA